MNRKKINTLIARLLIVMLLVQCLPAFPAAQQRAFAENGSGQTAESQGTDPASEPTASPEGSTEPAASGSNANTQEPANSESLGAMTVTQNVYAPTPKDIGKLSNYTWKQITLNLPPESRIKHVMAYDEKENKVLMFGGENAAGNLLNDTWLWDGTQQSWNEVMGLSPQPSARKSSVMAYDPTSQQVLLFGGEGSGSSLLGDTWLWDGASASWKLYAGASPSPRAGAQLAYDGKQLVLFGGYTGSGANKTPLSDTWLWDGTAWTQASPATSPPGVYDGQMSFDGTKAVLFGGNMGVVTEGFGDNSQQVTYNKSLTDTWLWDSAAQTWISQGGPESYGRWGQAMAYDGRRVVAVSGAQDFVNVYSGSAHLTKDYIIPSNSTIRGYNIGHPQVAYGWTGTGWEPSWNGYGSPVEAYLEEGDYPGIAVLPYNYPRPRSFARMAFDGENFVMFGGLQSYLKVYKKAVKGGNPELDHTDPGGVNNDTWVFGYTPPTPPKVKMTTEPILNFDTSPAHTDDSVSVVTDVYGTGGSTVNARGVEYRLFADVGETEQAWTKQAYTGTVTGETGTFTTTIKGLTWQEEYEVRGYATNQLGTSYTDTARFILKDDPNMQPPDVTYARVGPVALHVKDKKRIVAVGTGITNLLRKPISGIDYYLQSANGTKYPLDFNILNERQLELTWKDDLPPGKYDVELQHAFYSDSSFKEGLLITALDFYKPRNFGSVNVPSTSAQNETSALTLQGPFTEDPSAPKVYTLNDPNEIVTINQSVMFKGTQLTVDKSDPSGKSIIRGQGRLYVNGGGTEGPSISYTLLDGAFEWSSDKFAVDIQNNAPADYAKVGMPITLKSLVFTDGGLRLSGDLQAGFTAGSGQVGGTLPIDSLKFHDNVFDLVGKYDLKQGLKIGPFDTKNASLTVDSRFPYVGMTADAALAGTDLGFQLDMRTKYGRLDSVNFGTFRKVPLASTGLQVDYIYGNVKDLSGMSNIPQRFAVTGSVSDILVPTQKHPSVDYAFHMFDTDELKMNLSSYGFTATGPEFLYWLPVDQANITAIVNPKAAGIKGFSLSGFSSEGTMNIYDVIRGGMKTFSFNKLGFTGQMKATVKVPKSIPQVGGATVNNVDITMNDKTLRGAFTYNKVGVTMTYTFSKNLMEFELKMPPPEPSKWWTALEYASEAADIIDMFTMKSQTPRAMYGAGLGAAAAPVGESTLNLQRKSEKNQPSGVIDAQGAARIVEDKMTTIDLKPSVTTKMDGADAVTYSFDVDHTSNLLMTLSGNQTQASVEINKNPAMNVQRYYDEPSNTTFLQIMTTGSVKVDLHAKTGTTLSVNRILYAAKDSQISQWAAWWNQTDSRSVTTFELPERGNYLLQVSGTTGDTLVYKPDGRPYVLHTEGEQANRYVTSEGIVYAILDAAQADTWLVDGGGSANVSLYAAPANATIADVKKWLDQGLYPTSFEVFKTSTTQSIVEINGAERDTALYAPDGTLYPLVTSQGATGWNAYYDEASHKMSVVLPDAAPAGTWTVQSAGFVNVTTYAGSRKLKSPKPLIADGAHTVSMTFPESGDFLLALQGADKDTVLKDPDGKVVQLVFDETSDKHNAVWQKAGVETHSEVQVVSNQQANESSDTLYISLIGAKAGKWTARTTNKAVPTIQKILPVPTLEQAKATPVLAAKNQLNVSWAAANMPADTKVSVLLVAGEASDSGEVIATGLSAAGSETLTVPATVVPGNYRVVVVAEGSGWAPVYKTAADSYTVSAYETLEAPAKPTVKSTGSGEIQLSVPTVAGGVEQYRVWTVASSGTAEPVAEFAAQSGAVQSLTVSGLPTGAAYTLAVSVVGEKNGSAALSPLSQTVNVNLPVPAPAKLEVTLNTDTNSVTEQKFSSYDGTEETLLIAAAQKAKFHVTSDQEAELTLTINGQPAGKQHVTAGSSVDFDLNQLLKVTTLAERDYDLVLESVTNQGDRGLVYRKVSIDRTGPLLIASNGPGSTGELVALNGLISRDSRVLITGQTDSGASLTINDVKVPLDDKGLFVYYAPLDWQSAEDRKNFVMTAQDAAGNKTEYGFEILRDSGQAQQLPTSDLSALTFGGAVMSAPFHYGTTTYSAAASSEKVRLYAVAANGAATIKVAGETLGDKGFVELNVPNSGRSVDVQVVPVSGQPKTYTVQIKGFRSGVAALEQLSIRKTNGEVVQASPFLSVQDSYTAYVSHDINQITLTPQAVKPGSQITLQQTSVTDGQASSPLVLNVGDNTFALKVVSPDGSGTRTYEVHIVRAASSDASLQNVKLESAGKSYLSNFTSTVRNYQVSVPASVNQLMLTAVPADSAAQLRLNGQTITGAQSVSITRDIQTLALEASAADGTKITYTITVLRQQSEPKQAPLLSGLTLVDVKLDSEFSPYRHSYTAQTVQQGALSFTAQANDPTAIVSVDGKEQTGGGGFSYNLKVGTNMILINVEKADGTASQTYSIAVDRLASEESAPPVAQTPPTRPVQTDVDGTQWKSAISVERVESPQSGKIDTLSLGQANAAEMVQKALQSPNRSVRMTISDPSGSAADERRIKLDSLAIQTLAAGKVKLEIAVPEGSLVLSEATLKGLQTKGGEAYFRLVPIKDATQKNALDSRIQSSDKLKSTASGRSLSVVGVPLDIETNYSAITTQVVLPLRGVAVPSTPDAVKELLSQMVVYIEHSDGELEVQQGTPYYDQEGRFQGVAITVDKFSTFTIVRMNEAGAADTSKPYLSGYPNGTFQPSKVMTRAELAVTLARLTGAKANSSDRVTYPDVPGSHWASAEIASLHSSGLMVGDGAGNFRPNAPVTRAEMAKIAASLLPDAAASSAKSYQDVSGGWAATSIAQASAAGVLKGYPDGTFRPSQGLTRAEAVKVLNVLFNRSVSTTPVQSGWPDVAPGHWASAEIKAASGK
ncbi:hypothetical protein B9G55_04280 [Saccharibacillus sp. O16]|nr:hypothetical protein B9G55_04280 [Saccharibacillus sp. O16]